MLGELLIGLLIMVGLLIAGMHVATAMFSIAALAAWFYFGSTMFNPFGTMLWGTLNNFILIAMPLYILMGEILVRGGLAEKMYLALSDWVHRLPGRLLHTNIATSCLFASISGSSIATAATIGTVAFPTFRSRGYDDKWVLGSVAGGATLGILIPPSVNMIIFGAMTDTSVGKLFMAGFVPGFTLAALFMLVIAGATMFWPEITGRKEDVPPLADRLRNLKELVPAVAVIFVVMGSIYTGWATPTEAAAVGVVMSLILVAAKGRLTMALLRDSALSAVNVTAMTLLILVAAFYLNFILGLIGVPELISSAVSGTGMSPWQIIFVLVVLYLILGCFLDTMTMMIATIPIVFPVITHAGYDPIWAGIFIVVMCEIGLITPPVGMNLYVVQGVRGRGSIADVMKGIVPFLFCMLALVVLITIWPEIVMWLPNAVFG